jgi:predicted DNA-binding transcriptional regulator AlpA
MPMTAAISPEPAPRRGRPGAGRPTITDLLASGGERLVLSLEVQARLGISRRTLYRRMREAGFPRPIRWGKRFAWRARDLDAYICRLGLEGGTAAS